MAGIKIYDVCMVFHVYATDDDEARETVTNMLPKDNLRATWSWIYTTLNKGETNDTNN
jgi:hypothetical protein